MIKNIITKYSNNPVTFIFKTNMFLSIFVEARSRTDPTGRCLQAPGADRERLLWVAPGRRLL